MLQIYVRPLDSNSKYTELDLLGDEVIEMVITNKSEETFDKVFSPFTKEFNVPASGKNIAALIHYFDTNLQKTRKKILEAVITLNGEVYKKGRIAINAIQYVENVSQTITINFYTSISSIKDKVGEDKLTDLTYDVNTFIWNAENVYRNLTGQIPNDNIIVPLISNKRAWNYKGGGSGDIFNADNAITQDELRPAIRFSKVMDAILDNYGFDVECPLFDRPEYQNLFIYLNNSAGDKDFNYPIRISNSFNYSSNGNTATVTPNSGGIRISYNQTVGQYHKTYVQLLFNNLINVNTGWGWDDDLELEARIVYAGNTERTFNFTDFVNQTNNGKLFSFELNAQDFGQVVNIYFTLKSSVPLSCDGVGAYVFTYRTNVFNSFTDTRSANNIMMQQSTNFDISSTISNMKVADFLTSFFKTFNIRVLEESSDSYKMIWVTPSDVEDDKVNLSRLVNWNEYQITAPIHYKEIKFTHAENSMFRNKQYKLTAANKEFGSEIYNDVESDNSETFEIETNFQVLNYFELTDTTLLTSYAWETNGTQYFGDDNLIIFYFHGYEIIKDPKFFNTNVVFKYKLSAAQPAVQVAQYPKVQNYDKVTKHSITFDKYIDPQGLTEYKHSLYANYYQDFIENIYGNNSRKFKFNLMLDSNILKRLKITSTVIIENMQFTIDELKTDLVTGKTELTLTNIEYRADKQDYNIYPPALYMAGTSTNNSINVVFNGSSVDAPQTIAGHQVRYKRLIDSVWEYQDVLLQNNNQVSYSVTLEPLYQGTTYTVEVRSYDNLGKYSIWKTLTIATTGAAFLPPYKIKNPEIGLISVIGGVADWTIVTPITINDGGTPPRAPISGTYELEMYNADNSLSFSDLIKVEDIERPVSVRTELGIGKYDISIRLEAYDTEIINMETILNNFEVVDFK